ncbi:hypothetical protein NIA69_14400 [Gemmiger formicilis]|nr:hypothetical protein [Gemmiger formicilis]
MKKALFHRERPHGHPWISPFWQEKRTFETGLFVAGIFGEIKPGITDFVNLPTPYGEISNVMDILLHFPLLYPARWI